jgi:hypothetical protein
VKHYGKTISWQKIGASTGATVKESAASRHDAILLFKEAKERLTDINNWDKLCGNGSPTFQLTDGKGKLTDKQIPEAGDFVRISHAPHIHKTGHTYEWGRIDKIENEKNVLKDEEVFGFFIRSVDDPQNPNGAGAHFASSHGVSIFLVTRKADVVMAAERGYIGKPGISPAGLLNILKNTMMALIGLLHLSTPQWKGLVTGVIKGPAQRWERKIIYPT